MNDPFSYNKNEMHILNNVREVVHIKYHTHAIGGICFGVIASAIISKGAFEPQQMALITTSSLVGSLFPDIDEPQSFLGRKIKPVSRLIKAVLGHRGFIHTPLFCFLLVGFMAFFLCNTPIIDVDISSKIICGFLIGFMSHLILDTITPKGIMWLFPLSRKYFSTQSEWLVKLIILTSTVWFVVSYYDLSPIIKGFIVNMLS